MQNVLISEVPPAAAGRGGPEMIFFCTNYSFCTYKRVIHVDYDFVAHVKRFTLFLASRYLSLCAVRAQVILRRT